MTKNKLEETIMEAIKAKVGERYLNNKGTPVTVVGVKGDKVLLKVSGSDNEVPVDKNYEIKPFTPSGVSKDAKLLIRANGKGRGRTGKNVEGVSLAALIDPFLFAGGKTVREIAELVTKKASKLANGKDMKANVRARLWNYKKKNYVVQKDDKRRIRLVKKS